MYAPEQMHCPMTQCPGDTIRHSHFPCSRRGPFNVHSLSDVQRLYQSEYLGGQLTTVEGRLLRRFALNGEAAVALGRDNVGLFVTGRSSLQGLAYRLKKLGLRDCGGRWVTVVSSKNTNHSLRHLYFGGSDWETPQEYESTVWHDGTLTFCVPEDLRRLALPDDGFPAGILMVDGYCCVHRHRFGYVDKEGRPQNRAGEVADYRARHAVEGWLPPLVLFTKKAPAAVERTQIAGSLGLECFRYLT